MRFESYSDGAPHSSHPFSIQALDRYSGGGGGSNGCCCCGGGGGDDDGGGSGCDDGGGGGGFRSLNCIG